MSNLRVLPVGFCLFLVQSLMAGYSPTKTEINLGPISIDNYYATMRGRYLPVTITTRSSNVSNCSSTTIRQNPPYTSANYVGQGITGVRFQFALQAPGSSAPWDASGNVQTVWVSKLQAFFTDLHSYGITRVTPTPALNGNWSGTTVTWSGGPVYNCTGSDQLRFFKWLPYGFLQSTGRIDCQDYNDAYNIANNNPTFWGWSPFFDLVNQIFGAIRASDLQLGEFDMQNEVDLLNFTVLGRLFYDNVHSTDVLATLRSYATANYLDPTVITVSVPATNPTVAAYDCGSAYGDSATLIDASELVAAFAGGGGLIGIPFDLWRTAANGLPCGGGATGMISLPVSHSQPSVTDVHIYPCVWLNGGCNSSVDATSTATMMYSDLWAFLSWRGLSGNVMMAGETQPDQNCETFTTTLASQAVAGFKASSLYSSHAGLTTMRPWNYVFGSCYAAPTLINPPYDSQHQ